MRIYKASQQKVSENGDTDIVIIDIKAEAPSGLIVKNLRGETYEPWTTVKDKIVLVRMIVDTQEF